MPGMLAVAEAMLDAGAPEAAAAGVPLAEALPDVWRPLSTTTSNASASRDIG
jgi:hypothetical protein